MDDSCFLGRPHTIATVVVSGGGGLALIDPGPTTALETLELGLDSLGCRLRDVTHILLTHIHLDHAGATGSIVERHPGIKVLVHELGAPHMASPEKLLASAARLFGSQMDRLWGRVAALPRKNITMLRGGERLAVGGRTFEVAYTPGHASHHVSYFDASSGLAFVGDTAGIRIGGGYLLPATPPPDIDLDLWKTSVARIEQWAPQTLFLTHFGAVGDVSNHLQTMMANLMTTAGFVRMVLKETGTEEDRQRRFADHLHRDLRRQMNEAQLATYELAAPFDLLWLGLARYWRTRGV